MTTKAEKRYTKASDTMMQLQSKQDELEGKQREADAELSDYRKVSALALISGKDSEQIASRLNKLETKARIFSGGVDEIKAQTGAHELLLNEAEATFLAEVEKAERERTADNALSLIESMAGLQVKVYKARMQSQKHKAMNINFQLVSDKLQQAQEALETDPTITERSDVPSAERMGGFIDDAGTTTQGSHVQDWALAEAQR